MRIKTLVKAGWALTRRVIKPSDIIPDGFELAAAARCGSREPEPTAAKEI